MPFKLTDAAIRAATPKGKRYKRADGEGLSIEGAPTWGKWWRIKYRFGGKESGFPWVFTLPQAEGGPVPGLGNQRGVAARDRPRRRKEDRQGGSGGGGDGQGADL